MVHVYIPAMWPLVLPTGYCCTPTTIVSVWGWMATAVHTQGLPWLGPSVCHAYFH